MPPRYSYWTILAGGLPTAFRAADRDELLPTFHGLKRTHPDAELRWFARGRLWASPDEAKAAAAAPKPPGRGRDWRPGGSHQDPKQRYKDAKKDRNLRARHERFERRSRGSDAQNQPDKPPSAVRRDRPASHRQIDRSASHPGKPERSASVRQTVRPASPLARRERPAFPPRKPRR